VTVCMRIEHPHIRQACARLHLDQECTLSCTGHQCKHSMTRALSCERASLHDQLLMHAMHGVQGLWQAWHQEITDVVKCDFADLKLAGLSDIQS
jgi:hypothetical protein